MSATLLIGLHGRKRSGKDTLASALVEGRDFTQQTFAKPIYDALYALNPMIGSERLQYVVDAVGWELAKDMFVEVRTLLQKLGTEVEDILGGHLWVDIAMPKIDCVIPGTQVPGTKVIFSDVRRPSQAKAIVARGGVMVLVERPGNDESDGHSSEVLDWSYDFVVQNDGTIPELRQKAFDLADKLTQPKAKLLGIYHQPKVQHLPVPPMPEWLTKVMEAAPQPSRVFTENGHTYTLTQRVPNGPYSADRLYGAGQ